MIAGIVLDDWKLPVYTRHLKAAGYSWGNKGPFTQGVSILHVMTDNREALQTVLEAAEAEVKNRGTKQ